MSSLFLDSSVIAAAFEPEDGQHRFARALLKEESIALATLDLARYEVVNAAVRGWREPAAVPLLLSAVERIEEDDGVVRSARGMVANAASLADRHGLSVYDAAFAAAAQERGRILVSCDVRDLVSKGLAILPEAALDR